MQPDTFIMAAAAIIVLLVLLAFLLTKILGQLKTLTELVSSPAHPPLIMPVQEQIIQEEASEKDERDLFAVIIAAVCEDIGLPPDELQFIQIKEIMA